MKNDYGKQGRTHTAIYSTNKGEREKERERESSETALIEVNKRNVRLASKLYIYKKKIAYQKNKKCNEAYQKNKNKKR